MYDENFDLSFADHFRGSELLITARLRVYLPIIRTYLNNKKDVKVLDLAAGRGEFLELLRDEDIESTGVDGNITFVNHVRHKGLEILHGDVFEFLSNSLSNSVDLITAFHFIEHIDFASQREFYKEIYRVLKPNGMLILETPNSNNIFVASNTFWIDPSHIKPVNREILTFLASFYGFQSSFTIGIHPYIDELLEIKVADKITLDLNQDLAHFAIKGIAPEDLEANITKIKGACA
jgi:O-antigen chain-terminating methyltransferase